jgi:NAD dependent epimerase/dehydratase
VTKILITGAGGFIGSHLAERCVELGYEVRALVRYNSRGQWGWLESSPLASAMEIVAGDVRDFDAVSAAVQGCQAVFHLAALIGIPYSYRSPLAYIRTNVEGTYNVLEAARRHDVESTLVTSTSETYGSAQYVPIDESHPLVGQSPYSASKIAADQLAVSYHRSFGLPVKLVRPFNTYGPRQSARAIIPTIVTQILGGHTELRLGNLKPTRDLTYVMDTVEGFVEVFRAPGLVGEVVNVGMNASISIGDLVDLIAGLLDRRVAVREDEARVRVGGSEVEHLQCDNRKVLATTAWRPRYTLDAGLGETIEWLRQHSELYKPGTYAI